MASARRNDGRGSSVHLKDRCRAPAAVRIALGGVPGIKGSFRFGISPYGPSPSFYLKQSGSKAIDYCQRGTIIQSKAVRFFARSTYRPDLELERFQRKPLGSGSLCRK